MMIVSQFRQLNLSVVNVRTYLFAVLFVGGNMLLPQLCHLMPYVRGVKRNAIN